MKKLTAVLLLMAVVLSAAGCGNTANSTISEMPEIQEDMGKTTEETLEAQTNGSEENSRELSKNGQETDALQLDLKEIPEQYLEPNAEEGRVVRLDYETMTYDEENRKMDKYAYVYLPYGYDDADESVQYNVFYLMHGGTGNAELYLGGENGDRPLKRILDNLIANGDMEPMLVVTPTYYLDNQERGGGISQEDARLTANFYQELQNDLIPAVEGRYHTYAQSVDAGALQASREHRIFGGFSMGAVTTWYTFLYCMDYFKYYMPISGDCWIISGTDMGSADTADATAEYLSEYIRDSGYTTEDYVIYALTGTDDIAYGPLGRQIEAMKNYPESFVYSESAADGNLFFQVAKGGVHNYTSMIQYIYNALPVFGEWMRDSESTS